MQCVIPKQCATRELLGGLRRLIFCLIDLLKISMRWDDIVSSFPNKETKRGMSSSKHANHNQDQHFHGFLSQEMFLSSKTLIETIKKYDYFEKYF